MSWPMTEGAGNGEAGVEPDAAGEKLTFVVQAQPQEAVTA